MTEILIKLDQNTVMEKTNGYFIDIFADICLSYSSLVFLSKFELNKFGTQYQKKDIKLILISKCPLEKSFFMSCLIVSLDFCSVTCALHSL